MDLDEIDNTSNDFITTTADMNHFTIVQDHRHKTSSCVWKYFGNLKKNNELLDEKHVYCTKCFDESKMKKYQKSTSTGNLIKHLRKAHNVADQPSYRIKQENDRILVTKEETFGDEEGESEYFRMYKRVFFGHTRLQLKPLFLVDNNHSASYLTPIGNGKSNTPDGSSEVDTNEFLVHGN